MFWFFFCHLVIRCFIWWNFILNDTSFRFNNNQFRQFNTKQANFNKHQTIQLLYEHLRVIERHTYLNLRLMMVGAFKNRWQILYLITNENENNNKGRSVLLYSLIIMMNPTICLGESLFRVFCELLLIFSVEQQ